MVVVRVVCVCVGGGGGVLAEKKGEGGKVTRGGVGGREEGKGAGGRHCSLDLITCRTFFGRLLKKYCKLGYITPNNSNGALLSVLQQK